MCLESLWKDREKIGFIFSSGNTADYGSAESFGFLTYDDQLGSHSGILGERLESVMQWL